MGDLARILIYGDIHLCSKHYGAHINYPKESLELYEYITKVAEEKQVTHLIGLGDFSYGRFNTLEYREQVEALLERQYRVCGGNHLELKGNHDSASYGMTEYEYYIKKGLLRPSQNFTIGNVHFTLVDSGKYTCTEVNMGPDEESINVILAHDFFKFKNTDVPDFGKVMELDNFTPWYGVDHLICGHIHNQLLFDDLITKTGQDGQTHGHRVMVQYPGCLTRPAYREGHMDLVGQLIYLVIRDNGDFEYNVLDVPLKPLNEAFNLTKKAVEHEKKQAKEQRVDISDVIEQLNSHKRNIGNPEDIIMSLSGVDAKYKEKAIELLKLGQA